MKPTTPKSDRSDSGPEPTGSDNWITDIINAGVALGGTKVTEDEYERRKSICQACSYHQPIQFDFGLATIETPGCTRCGCPTATKPRWERYFSLSQLRIIKATCPHPEEDKWEAV